MVEIRQARETELFRSLYGNDLDTAAAYACDCAPADGTTWAAPTEAPNLRFTGPGTLEWDTPAAPGAEAVLYDVLRSALPGDFSLADCLESDGADLTASEGGSSGPGICWYYLVRVENVCGGNLGKDSGGTLRMGRSCP